jgi:DME family drug/metabolite transporter
VVVLVITALLWSLNGPLIKLLHDQSRDRLPFTSRSDVKGGGAVLASPPHAAGVAGVTIAFYRSFIGGIVFLPAALRHRRELRRVHWGWPVGSVLTFTLMTACFVIATTETAAANAIILQYTSPIWVFALSPLVLNERPRLLEGLWLLLAMAGVGVILAGQWQTDLRGLLIALGSGLGYGSLTVALRGLRPVRPSVVVALNFIGSGLLLLPAALVAATLLLTGRQWLLMLLLGIVQFSVPYALFSWALQRVHAHQAALIVLLEAIMNPLLTWVIVGEPVPSPTLLGGPLILLSIAGWMAATWHRRPPQTSAAAPARAESPPSSRAERPS